MRVCVASYLSVDFGLCQGLLLVRGCGRTRLPLKGRPLFPFLVVRIAAAAAAAAAVTVVA